MHNQPNWNNMYSAPSASSIAYVTSPEEAIMRTNQYDTEAVYFDQSKPVFYRVKVDYDGRKSWAAFTYTVNNVDNTQKTDNISREEFTALVEEVKELKSKIVNLGGNTNE